MSRARTESLELGDTTSLQDVWRAAAGRYRPVKGRLPGYLGLWQFYSAEGSQQDSLEKCFRCARLYCADFREGGQPEALIWRAIHEAQPGLERAHQREQDGFWECTFRRSLSEPYFSGVMAPDATEQAQGLPNCLFWRSILLPPQGANSARLPLSLPPDPVEEYSEPGQHFENWNPQLMQTTVWAFETFLQDEGVRWSGGPLYNMQTLRLITHFVISEREQSIDPDGKMTPDKWQLHSPRGRLPEDPSKWLEGGTWTGTMHEYIWDEDGEIMALRPRPAAWRAPALQNTHRLFCYDDCMYAHYPLRIGAAQVEATSTFANGVRFEFGGLMRSTKEFRRVVLRYSVKGGAESLVVERYTPSELSGFDGKARRSIDVRDKRQSMDTTRERFKDVKLADHTPSVSRISEH